MRRRADEDRVKAENSNINVIVTHVGEIMASPGLERKRG